MRLVHQNSSIHVKREPPRVSYRFLSKGIRNTLQSLRIARKPPPLLCFSRGFKKCGLFIKIHPLARKRGDRVFLACLCQREEWRVFTESEIHGNFPPCDVLHGDQRNVVSSSESIHPREKGATVCFWPVSAMGRNEGSSQSQKCIETSSLAKFCMGIQEMMLVHQNPSTCTKREPPCVSGLVLSKGGMKSLNGLRNAWKLPPLRSVALGFRKWG